MDMSPIPKRSYKRNFLKKVILRLDFEKVELDFLADFSEAIEREFPFQESKEGVNSTVTFDTKTGKVDQAQQKNIIWTYSNLQKTKRIQIHSNFVIVEYDVYKDKTELLKDTEETLVKFITSGKLETLNRLGLRYTNQIDLSNIKGTIKWNKYINQNLLGGLEFANTLAIKSTRCMSKLVLRKELADITYNFGMWNNDFPSEIKTKEFILDFDCFSPLPIPIAPSNITKLVETYNSYAEDLFENSITDNLRKILRKNHDKNI